MIRLTFITLAGLFAAMLVWGTESGEQPVAALAESIGAPVETTIVETVAEPEPIVDPVAELVIELAETTTPEPSEEDAEEVARLNTIDLTAPPKPSTLIVVQSSDAPAGEPLLTAVTAAVNEAVTEAVADTAASASPRLLAVNARSVNLRAGPSTSLAIVGNLKRGEQAELIAEAADGWLQIREISTGQIGYMAGRFLDPITQ